MARVKFKDGQPIQSLSGTIGDMVFRTVNGKTYVHKRTRIELPEQPTRAEKKQYLRERILDQCVCILQDEIGDMNEAIRMRTKIRSRLCGLYKKYEKEYKAPTKLQIRIMTEYRSKWCAQEDGKNEESPISSR